MVLKQKTNFWEGRRVLVTGSEGFLGSWMAETLIRDGADVIGVDKAQPRLHSILSEQRHRMTAVTMDLSSWNGTQEIFREWAPEYVFHLAAEAIVGDVLEHPRSSFESNIQGTWNVLEACRTLPRLRQVLVASTDKAYGIHPDLPYTESCSLNADHPYDVSKACADMLARTYFQTYQLPCRVIRCGNIYGPGDFHRSRLIPDTIISALKQVPLRLRSDGSFTRDYIFVEDVVTAYLALAALDGPSRREDVAFNVSTDEPVRVDKVCELVHQIIGRDQPEPLRLNAATHEIPHQTLTSVKARAATGWKPRVSLKEGLQRTIEWYVSHE